MAKHLTDFDPKLYKMHKENACPEDEVNREKYEIALGMAEWKDVLFQKRLDKEIENLKSTAYLRFRTIQNYWNIIEEPLCKLFINSDYDSDESEVISRDEILHSMDTIRCFLEKFKEEFLPKINDA